MQDINPKIVYETAVLHQKHHIKLKNYTNCFGNQANNLPTDKTVDDKAIQDIRQVIFMEGCEKDIKEMPGSKNSTEFN